MTVKPSPAMRSRERQFSAAQAHVHLATGDEKKPRVIESFATSRK